MELLLLPMATFAFVTSITPGPNNIMLASSGINFGFARTVPHICGVVLGFRRAGGVMCGGGRCFNRCHTGRVFCVESIRYCLSIIFLPGSCVALRWRRAKIVTLNRCHSAPPRCFNSRTPRPG